jgi:hypothetical protein
LLVHVDDREKVVVLGVGIDAPDVEQLLRPIEPFDERRQAGFGREHGRESQRDDNRSDGLHDRFLV